MHVSIQALQDGEFLMLAAIMPMARTACIALTEWW
jgi:hypothetical protein